MRHVTGVLFVVSCGLCISPMMACGNAEDRNNVFRPDTPPPTATNSNTAGGGGVDDPDGSVGNGGTPGAGGKETAWVKVDPNQAGSEAAGGGTACEQDSVAIEPLPPDIMIVQDRSMSMTDDMNGKVCDGGSMSGDGKCGQLSKWYQVKEAVKTVVQATQTTVNWGLFWLGSEPDQCGVSTNPIVEITAKESYAPISQALDGEAFTGQVGTPTAQAINNAVAYLQKRTDPNPKYLLLATDGEPNCASGQAAMTDTNGSVTAVTNAKKAKIPTFVVGIAVTGSATANDALNKMAAAGGQAQTGTQQYYAVSDAQTLSDALKKIIGLALPCTISLEKTPKGEWSIAIGATDATTGEVVEIQEDPANGWTYTDDKHTGIQLNGDACSNLKSGNYSNFAFYYTCIGQKPHVF